MKADRAGTSGEKVRLRKECGDDKIHDKGRRKCRDCSAVASKTKSKQKKRKKGDSDSENESESEEEVWDVTKDEQLNQNLEDRIKKVEPESKIEYCCETNVGDSWFEGMVHHINGDGTVKFVEDDGTIHHNFCLRGNIWKFL